MKSYKGSHSTPPLILNLIASSIEGWLCRRAGVDVTEEMKPLIPAGIGTPYHSPHSLVTVLTELSQSAGTYRVSQEECAILRESVSYVKLYRYNPKHLYPNLNGYGDNGQRSLKL